MNIEKPSTQLGGIANLALLAPVRRGFIPGAEPFTYAERLKNFFKTLNAVRLGSRESTLHESPFPDAIERWGILQSFRYALIPPEIGSTGEPVPVSGELVAGVYRLALNVTFDGGWETYMRIIYRDIGSLLDAIFCNCEGYPASRRHSYDEYIAWVRSREIPAGIFYAESAKSVLDQRYLEHVERELRDARDEGDKPAGIVARRKTARFALPTPKTLKASLEALEAASADERAETIDSNLRALKGLYDLRAYYTDNADGDDQCLLRFAQEAMPEFRAALPGVMLQLQPTVRQRVQPLVDWLGHDLDLIEAPKVQLPSRPDEEIQSGLLSSYTGVTHGCLFLLAITDPGKARTFLAQLEPQVTTEAPSTQQVALPDGVHYCNVAFTAHGLAKLGVAELGLFPQEFLEGMEARAGLLGDLRGNHPDRWRRPKFEGRDIDFASVHIVVQYRLRGDASDKSADLHEALKELGQSLRDGDNGLRLLSAEPMRSFPEDQTNITREHFGFRDGFSQPMVRPRTAGVKWDDGVSPGELFLGHPNDRDDPPFPRAPSALRDNGSFLVIRKIRQHVRAWNDTLRAAAKQRNPAFDGLNPQQQAAATDDLAAKLMGRDKEGNTLANGKAQGGNNFDYAADPDGAHCPFQSHARRANPRTVLGPKAKMPRIVRRGMSYGARHQANEDPEVERGLYFMAYCGSIAEQFEVIQRWLAGGNSSGILSAHSDPLLGVPRDGVQRSFQWLEGADVQRIDLPVPLTNLEWGLYLFVPSRTGLRVLSKLPHAAQQMPAQPLTTSGYAPGSAAFLVWREHISARENRDALWRRVKDSGGDLQTPYGRLVSNPTKVFEILRDDGRKYSVCGYGRRFASSVGEGFLGMDPAGGHQRLAIDSGVTTAIASIGEEKAFYAARQAATHLLGPLTTPGTSTNVDVAQFAEMVLAELCTLWFGLPDKASKYKYMAAGPNSMPIEGGKPPHCPRDFVLAARHIFGAHPTNIESAKGTTQGDLIKKGVVAFLRSQEWQNLAGGEAMLAKDIERRLKGETPEVVAQTIAGVMLGFAPSTHGNFVNLLRAWSERTADVTLWDLQTALLEAKPSIETGKGYEAVRDTLRAPLIAQMRMEPIPATVWREKTGSTKPDDKKPEPEKIVIGLHGVMQHEGMHEMVMWGGVLGGFVPPDTMPDLPGDIDLRTVHACPGYGMATGVLLGIFSSVLLAGTLLSTPSPLILKIKP